MLLVASELPFMEVLGVEFARELHEIARENIRRYRSASQQCKRVQSLHVDATAFELPPSPLVVFMSNPIWSRGTRAGAPQSATITGLSSTGHHLRV